MTDQEQLKHMRKRVLSTLQMLDVYRYHVALIESSLSIETEADIKIGMALGAIEALTELDPARKEPINPNPLEQ